MLVVWRMLMAWQAAHAQGIMVGPNALFITLPLWLSVVAYHLAGALMRRLERFWDACGW